MLTWFISVNRRAARKLEEKYPRFFLESRNFGDECLGSSFKCNTRAFQTLYDVMSSGAVMQHYIPSGFHPYSIALKIVGSKPQKWLIRNLRPRQDDINTTGYPSFFNHCDPTSMRTLLERTGFRNVELIIYYKATDYFAFFLPAYVLVATFEDLASKMGWKIFASGMLVTATKP